MQTLPDYDELPDGRAWGLWSDHFGSLNLLTAERVAAGVAEVQKGSVFALNWEMQLPDPPLFERAAFHHEVSWLANEVGHDDLLGNWNTQSSSQWDGFRHIQYPGVGFFGGVADEDHGIHHWARRGIVGRAVLADVARWRASVGRPLQHGSTDPIEPSDLVACLAAQGTDFEPGDILLVRTGWIEWYSGLDVAGREELARDMKTVGVRPGIESARTIWNLHPAAVAADNPAFEVWPPGATLSDEERSAAMAELKLPELFLHFSLLPLLGIPIGEMWFLEALAADCAEDGRYSCLLTSAPLNLKSGVASPPNALAIK